MIQQKSIGEPVKDSIRSKFFSNQPTKEEEETNTDKPFPPLRQDSINSQSYQYTPYPKIGQVKDEDETGPSKKRVYDSEPAVQIGDTPYFYLNNDILSRNFALCSGFDYDSLPLEHKESPPTYNVYLCMYAINTDCSLPFLEYFLVKSGDAQYSMPHFEFSCTDEMKALEGSDEDPIQTHFQNQCFEHFLEESHITENMDHLEEYYKGFVSIPGVEGSPIPNRIQPGDHVIVAFFDCTKNKSEMVEKMDGTLATWALLHEIVYTQKVQGLDIEPIVYQFFYEKPETCLIRDEEGFQLMIPRILYLCKQKGNAGFENVYIDESKESKDSTLSISMLDDRCEHRLFGYYYYFSARPIDPTYKDVNKLVRYAGFPEHCLYVLRDVGNIKKVVSVIKNDEADEEDQDQDQELESVKEPPNEIEPLLERKVGGEEPGPMVMEESKEEALEESKEEALEESKEEDDEEKVPNEPVDEEDEDENDETISWSTYFQENDIPYYLFKKTNLFTKLA